MKKFLGVTLFLVLLLPLSLTAQQNSQPLTNEDIVSMVKAGLTPEIVVAKIKSSPCQFDTSPSILETLKKEGVPDPVILAMVQVSPAAHNRNAEIPPQPTVDQILRKYIEALGGRAAIGRLTSLITRSTVENQGNTGMAEQYAKAPNKFATTTQLPGAGEIREGFDGSVGWIENAQGGVREMTGQELAIVERRAEFYGPLRLQELYPKMTMKGEQSVEGHPAFVIEANPGDGSLARLYFDAESGLLVRRDLEYDSPQGRGTLISYLEDYRDVGGVKMPFVLRQSNAAWASGTTVTFRVTEALPNVPIDDTKFQRPSASVGSNATGPWSNPLAPNMLRAVAWRGVPWATTSYYQQPGGSYTSCTGQGQWLGNFYQSNLSCTGSYTPAQNIPITWSHYTIFNLVETSDSYVVVSCTRNWRFSKCSSLIPGNIFPFQYKKGQIWITGQRAGKRKQETLKYDIVATQPKASP